MATPRPSVFIGSSSEGLPLAEILQLNMDHSADVVLWSQGVFGLSDSTLESLVNSLPQFDFAVLVLTPDDMATIRGDAVQLPRDNVLFELGLFMGHLGRERCFILYDRTKPIKLPSDLAGVTAATFQPHASGNLQSALGAPSTLIKGAIQKLGKLARAASGSQIDTQTQFQVITDLLDKSVHQFLILMHEKGVALQREDGYGNGPAYEYAYKNGAGNGGLQVKELCGKLADAGLLTQNLRGKVDLTERGHAFAEWLISSGYKLDYFKSDLGGWGTKPKDFPEQWTKQPPKVLLPPQN